MEAFVYGPKGVCPRETHFEMNGDIIHNVTIISGRAGSLLGISRIIKDKKIDEIPDTFRGVRHGAKLTFYSDQVAEVLSEYTRKLGQAGSLCLWHRAVKI